MPSFNLYNIEGNEVGTVEQPTLFETPIDQKLIHRYFIWVRTMLRPTLAHTKSRGEVSGGGKKPWRQKGTGRARVGSTRSSLWRHGSIAHGPKPRDYSTKINEKMLLGALRSALAAKFQENKLTVVDEFKLAKANTKSFAGALKKLEMGNKVLLVENVVNRNLELSSRNIHGCDLMRHHTLHPYHVLSHDSLLITEGALVRIAERLR